MTPVRRMRMLTRLRRWQCRCCRCGHIQETTSSRSCRQTGSAIGRVDAVTLDVKTMLRSRKRSYSETTKVFPDVAAVQTHPGSTTWWRCHWSLESSAVSCSRTSLPEVLRFHTCEASVIPSWSCSERWTGESTDCGRRRSSVRCPVALDVATARNIQIYPYTPYTV